eukprot:4229310-Amphidinium_carterae.1
MELCAKASRTSPKPRIYPNPSPIPRSQNSPPKHRLFFSTFGTIFCGCFLRGLGRGGGRSSVSKQGSLFNEVLDSQHAKQAEQQKTRQLNKVTHKGGALVRESCEITSPQVQPMHVAPRIARRGIQIPK